MCKKCGGANISGPAYHRNLWGIEELVYRCVRCGYSWSRPTNDSSSPSYEPDRSSPFKCHWPRYLCNDQSLLPYGVWPPTPYTLATPLSHRRAHTPRWK